MIGGLVSELLASLSDVTYLQFLEHDSNLRPLPAAASV